MTVYASSAARTHDHWLISGSSQAGSDISDTDRAPIRMAHDTPHLTISQGEANRIDEEAKKRLLAARKLSLVVDLDQTIIHAAVDPTIAEWQKDKDNPNYEAVKDVRSFQLMDDGPGMRGCYYFIKLVSCLHAAEFSLETFLSLQPAQMWQVLDDFLHRRAKPP